MAERMFSIYDKKAEAFGRPFFAKTLGMGERMFMDAVNQEDSEFSRHPHDFILYSLGTYSEDSGGLLQTKNEPTELVSAAQVLKKKEEEVA